MKYLFIAAMLMMFNPTVSAFDGHEKYENMSYEELKKVDKKSLKGKDKAAYMKALNKAKKDHKGAKKSHAKDMHAKDMKGDMAHAKGHKGKMKAADHKKKAMEKKKKAKEKAKNKDKKKDKDDDEDEDDPDA